MKRVWFLPFQLSFVFIFSCCFSFVRVSSLMLKRNRKIGLFAYSFFKYKFIYFTWRLITLQYFSGFAIHWHESATGVHVFPILNPSCPRHLPPYIIPLGHPSAPAPSTLSHALNLDWRSVSRMIIHTHTFFIFRHIPSREMTLLLRPLFSLILERYNTTVLFYTAERTLHCHYRLLVKRSARITVASHN